MAKINTFYPVLNSEGKKIACFNIYTKELHIKKGKKLTILNFYKDSYKVKNIKS